MKFIAFPIIIITIFKCAAQQPTFEITGVLNGLGNRTVILGNKPDGYSSAFKIKYFDTCIAENDTFHFSGHVDYPDFYSIEVEGMRGWKTFILTNNKILISIDSDAVYRSRIIGSEETDAYNKFEKGMWILRKKNNFFVHKLDSLRKLRIEDSTTRQPILDSVESVTMQRHNYIFHFIKKHSNRFVSLSELNAESRRMNQDSVRKYFSLLSNKLQESPKGKELYYRIYTKDILIQKGSLVPDVEIMNNNGNLVSISVYQGKVILLDFWASWCGPCIEEFPELKILYKKYQEKGFEILGISLDTDKADWLSAIEEHNIPWETFCDLKGNITEAYQIFDSDHIPFLVLLDINGNLIDLNLTMGQLKKELKRIFHF